MLLFLKFHLLVIKVIKKIILISLICLFCIRPALIYSQETSLVDTNETTTEESHEPGLIEQFLNAIINFFGHLIFGTNYISREYKAPASYNTKEKVNDYTSEVNDYSSRAIPQSQRIQNKGVYFYEVLFRNQQPYENRSILDNLNKDISCPTEISIKDIVCFYAQKYQSGEISEKILYKRGSKEPTDYSEVSGCPTLQNNDQCYINAYENYQDVPHGKFYGKDDTAAIASTQLNSNIRTFIPDNYQGETAPDNNDSQKKIDVLVKDSNKQEEVMLLNFIPNKTQDYIGCTNEANINRDNLRQTFKCNLTPDSQSNNDCDLNGEVLDTTQKICIEDLHQKNGPGISQRGAHGMALMDFKYNQIITSYYTDKVSTAVIKGFDNQQMKVIMIDDTDFNKNGISDNDANCPSIGPYDKADLEVGKGGVYSDGLPCVYETITQTQPSSNQGSPTPTPKKEYRVKVRDDLEKYPDQCFSTVTVDLHTYLLGLAEDPVSWHVEAHKAIIIAARGEAVNLTNKNGYIKNSSAAQIFQCNRVIQNKKENTTDPLTPKVTNQRAAVDLTRDEVLVYKNTKNRISDSTHRSAFCGPGSNNPSFDGWEYETLSHLYGTTKSQNKSIGGICFEGIGYTLGVNKDIAQNSTNDSLQAYQSNPKNVVLGQTSNQKDCLLDSRVISPLDQLIASYNSQNTNNSLNLISCYRSTQEQELLWQEYLQENNRDELKTISQINYPGTSPHQTGLAIDFGDKFGKLTKNSSSYQWLTQNASQFGFYHHPLEPEHWQYKP